MTKDEIRERLEFALAEVEEIDLRGRRKGTLIHDTVTTARGELAEAIQRLQEEG